MRARVFLSLTTGQTRTDQSVASLFLWALLRVLVFELTTHHSKVPLPFVLLLFCCWQEAKHLRQYELLAGEVHQQSRGVGRRAHGTTARGEEENRYLRLLRMPVTLLMANHLSFFPPLLSINRGIALRNVAPLRSRATQTGT